MRIPRLKKCCCNTTLNSASQAIATTEIIFMGILTLGSVIICYNLGNPSKFPDLTQNNKYILYGLYISLIIVAIIQILVSISMINGILSKKPKLMKPWLIFAIFTIIEIIVMAVLSGIVFTDSDILGEFISGVVLSALFAVVLIALKIYYFLVVYNTYLEIKSELRQTDTDLTTDES